jgi:hypothetical protein
MDNDFVTRQDLQVLRTQLVSDIKLLLQSRDSSKTNRCREGYKTKDVRKILGCSVNKLVSLRIERKIRWKKIGGTVYYNQEDVRCLLEEGF